MTTALDPWAEAKRWVAWHTVIRKGKATKLPVGDRGYAAESNNPETWLTWIDAEHLRKLRAYDGVGIELGDLGDDRYLVGIDLDSCFDTARNPLPWAQAILSLLPTYAEISPSGGGIKLFFYIATSNVRPFLRLIGVDEDKWGCKRSIGSNGAEHGPAIEFYAAARFFTTTGDRWMENPNELALIDLLTLNQLARFFPSPHSGKGPPGAPAEPDQPIDRAELQKKLDAALKRRKRLRERYEGGVEHLKDTSRSARDFSLGAMLKAAGFTYAEMRTVLIEWEHGAGREKADAGDERYFERLWSQTAVTDPDVPLRFSENALAHLFTAEHPDLVYVHEWGMWLSWRAGRWREDHAVTVFDAARAICAREGNVAISMIPSGGYKIAAMINKAAAVAAIERLARHHAKHVLPSAVFDADPLLLNTPLDSCDLRDAITPSRSHHKEDYATRMTTVAAAETADCPIWCKFLDRIMAGDPQMVAYLQRVCGYMLTGSVEEHALFFGFGTGANGKGTFANVLLGILGVGPAGYAAVAPISTFTASQTEQHPTDLAMLRGVRCVIAQETEEGRSWAISKLKMMTGGDLITARFMRENFFTYAPQFKIMICGNHKPMLRGVDEATRRRFHLIPFTVTIPPADRDPKLGEKLKAEYPGILRWMIDGCVAWQRDGLNPPKTVTDATAAYLIDEDSLTAWLTECCWVGKSYYDTLVNLFASWKAWAEANGERVGQRKELAKALDARPELTRRMARTGRAGWDGLAVMSPQPPPWMPP